VRDGRGALRVFSTVCRGPTTACSGRAESGSLIFNLLCAPLMPSVRPLLAKDEDEKVSGQVSREKRVALGGRRVVRLTG